MKSQFLLKTYISTFWNEYRNSKEEGVSKETLLAIIILIFCLFVIIVVYSANILIETRQPGITINHKEQFGVIIALSVSIIYLIIFVFCKWIESDKTKCSIEKANEKCNRIRKDLEFKDNI